MDLASLYIGICQRFDGDLKLMNAVVSYGVGIAVYVVMGCLLLLPDLAGRPGWLLKYKVQPEEQVDPGMVKKALKTTVFNMCVISPGVSLLLYLFGGSLRYKTSLEEIPSVPRFALEIAACLLIQEITFYYIHRALHTSLLYKPIHKWHHAFTAPFALMAPYAHPVEHLFGDIFSVLIGPYILGTHVITLWAWLIMFNHVSMMHHSGYHLPLLSSPQFHDFHHTKFNANYGTWGLMDRIHGTDGSFRHTIQEKRHVYLISTSSVNELMPAREQETLKSR